MSQSLATGVGRHTFQRRKIDMEYVKISREEKQSLKVNEIWAYVSEDDDGMEGLIGMKTDQGWMPFVCADQVRVEALREHARHIQKASGKAVRLKHFRLDEVTEQI